MPVNLFARYLHLLALLIGCVCGQPSAWGFSLPGENNAYKEIFFQDQPNVEEREPGSLICTGENGLWRYDSALESSVAAKKLPIKNPSWCFPPGTLVLMADGSTKPIEDIVDGDWVIADDPEDGQGPNAREVLYRFNGRTARLIHISFDRDGDNVADGEFRATGQHPIWVPGAGWKKAEDIVTGDLLQDDKGARFTVIKIRVENGDSLTHNLSVDGVHSFFIVVNDCAILVHNQDLLSGPHGSMPSPRPAGMQSHHVIQEAWVKANYGADYKLLGMHRNATAILLDVNPTHVNINGLQNDFRASRVLSGQAPYGTSLRQEFNFASEALRAGGVDDSSRKRALKKAYKYFDSIDAFCP